MPSPTVVPPPSPSPSPASSPIAAKPGGAASPSPSPRPQPSPSAAASAGCQGGGYVEALVAGTPRLTIEVAATDAERMRGLMFRESMPPDHGMLFIFPQATSGGFWMQNTLIPLSIAFILEDGRILDIQDMQPLTTTPHAPPGAYRYALEVNQGWYAAHNVRPGDRLRLCA